MDIGLTNLGLQGGHVSNASLFARLCQGRPHCGPGRGDKGQVKDRHVVVAHAIALIEELNHMLLPVRLTLAKALQPLLQLHVLERQAEVLHEQRVPVSPGGKKS